MPTKCSIPTTATPTQQKRLRKLINDMSPWQRHGLQEYLDANRHQLDKVIKNLKELQDADTLNHVLDGMIKRLERGQAFKRGELVSVSASRAYPAQMIPDIRGDQWWGQMLSPKSVRKAMQVLGKKIGDFGKGGLPGAVLKAWNDAADAVRAAEGDIKTAFHYNKVLYPKTQRRFWVEVRKSPTAMKFFEDRSFWFPPGQGAPLHAAAKNLPNTFREEFRISLDHIARKEVFWRQALDAENLRFVSQWDNWLLNEIEGLKKAYDPGFK